jgi:prepilin-type processing-associated H-X9-DG protein
MTSPPRPPRSRGITLVELLVVIGILGVLVGMLLPAIQSARESARRAQCGSNLKNIGLALANFHNARKSFPLGSDARSGTEHAWSSRILPFLEEDALARQINYQQPWDAPGANLAAADQDVAVYICPSSVFDSPGKQDYGGVIGTSLLPLPMGYGPQAAFGCGILIVSGPQQSQPIRAAQITDGLSTTLCVGESADSRDGAANRWACGRNCFAQTDDQIHNGDLGGLFSHHPSGAHGLFADGHVRLLTDDISEQVLGAICTRNGAEVISSADLAN